MSIVLRPLCSSLTAVNVGVPQMLRVIWHRPTSRAFSSLSAVLSAPSMRASVQPSSAPQPPRKSSTRGPSKPRAHIVQLVAKGQNKLPVTAPKRKPEFIKPAPLSAVVAPNAGPIAVDDSDARPGRTPRLYTTDFSALGCSPDVVRGLREGLHISAATEIQALAIPHVLSGRDTVMAAQTGTGKTLAYLIPLIQNLRRDERTEPNQPASSDGATTNPALDGVLAAPHADHSKARVLNPARPQHPRALVIVPNRELAMQVLAVAKSIGHFARFRCESFSGGERPSLQKRMLQSPIELAVATPGRLLQLMEAKQLSLDDCRYVVIDEADTMLLSENGWWDDLKPILEPLQKRTAPLSAPQFVLCTASLTVRISKQIAAHFPTAHRIDSSFLHRTLSTLDQHFIPVGDNDKQLLLAAVLREERSTRPGADRKSSPRLSASGGGGSTIVFCNTVASCRSTEHFLREAGFSTIGYHGEIPPNLRAENYAKFVSGERPILVATDIASRGLDTRFVRHVVLFDFPLNPIDYLHRVGRTARAGGAGKVTGLLLKGDRPLAMAIQRAVSKSEPIENLSSDRRSYATKPRRVARVITKRRSIADKKRGIPRPPLIMKGDARSEQERRSLDYHRHEEAKKRAFQHNYTRRIAVDRKYRAKKRAWKTTSEAPAKSARRKSKPDIPAQIAPPGKISPSGGGGGGSRAVRTVEARRARAKRNPTFL